MKMRTIINILSGISKSRGVHCPNTRSSWRALRALVSYNDHMLEVPSPVSWGRAVVLAIVLNGCATELPAITESTDSATTLVLGRVTTVLTGERKRIYEPILRAFELENQQTHQRFRVDVQSDNEQFALSLPPGTYELSRIQISEGPFMSMAQLSASFTLEQGAITYLGTWRFGVDSPRYGRIVVLSTVVDAGDRGQAEHIVKQKYSARETHEVTTALPDPAQGEARLYEVMPYPRYPHYFQRHYW